MLIFFKLIILLFLFSITPLMSAQEATKTLNNLNETSDSNFSKASKKKQKPLCFIYGNCQLYFVYQYLKANFPEKYEYQVATNYLIINGTAQFPAELAKKADLFIYQPLQGHGINNTDYIKENYLKESCSLISLPYIYFLGYFPDFTQDPRNLSTMNPLMPFGFFPYGSQRLMDLIAEGYSTAEIIEKSYHEDFIPKEQILEKLYKSLSILRDKEQFTDIKLADFIEHNFQTHHLFYSPNHPTNYLLKELINQVLKKMHLSTKQVKKSFFDKEFFATWTNSIIYPCVAKTLNLQFDISHVMFMNDMVFYPIYIAEYIRCLYP